MNELVSLNGQLNIIHRPDVHVEAISWRRFCLRVEFDGRSASTRFYDVRFRQFAARNSVCRSSISLSRSWGHLDELAATLILRGHFFVAETQARFRQIVEVKFDLEKQNPVLLDFDIFYGLKIKLLNSNFIFYSQTQTYTQVMPGRTSDFPLAGQIGRIAQRHSTKITGTGNGAGSASHDGYITAARIGSLSMHYGQV